VVLFDEIEKAHPDVFNVLLQILDDGRVTDAQGHTVNFKNTIIIMTSNIGSAHITENLHAGVTDIQSMVLAELRGHFRPEFLNRVDETVVFGSLTREDLVAIVEIQLARFAKLFVDKRIAIQVTDQAKRILANRGYDPVYGARPLKREIQKTLETPVSRMLIDGTLQDGRTLNIGEKNGELTFTAA
jgi:ATP-dependent Clp protease ATP-binding subunit ClpB